jgi:hypothetical protein
MKLAIENFVHFPAEDKILLLGYDGVGCDSLSEHQQIIQQIGKINGRTLHWW